MIECLVVTEIALSVTLFIQIQQGEKMSGVAGASRVQSRADFNQFLKSYSELISQFPGFVSFDPTGSYNSDLSKNDFGDIDGICYIESTEDKKTVKKQLEQFFKAQPETIIVPFDGKYAGRRTYNSGEIVSVRYQDMSLGYSAQVDNMIALSQSEATFKQDFLDMPAAKQGLVLGLVKAALLESDPAQVFKALGINAPMDLQDNQEYEFNLSSTELQLRKVTYEPGTYKQVGREIVWTSRNINDLVKLLAQFDLSASFEDLLNQIKTRIKNPRSANRIKGTFNSMISVKSGEVNTPKGAGKEQAIQKVNQTLSESSNLSRMLVLAGLKKRG